MSISTVADLLATKGKRQLVLTTAFDAWTAKAAEESGIDMILAWGESLEHSKWVIDSVRQGAPNTLIGSGLPSIGAFSSDILGTHTGHYPRHSITYASLFKTAVDALSRYREDVLSGDYPGAAHTIGMADQEYEAFSASLESRIQR